MIKAYQSFNNPLSVAWTTIAPGIVFNLDPPDGMVIEPSECLRVYWQSYGDPTGQGNEREAVIDIAVRVPSVGNKPQTNLALTRCLAIDVALCLDDSGLVGGTGRGRMGRFDWTNGAHYLNDMDIIPDGGWIPIPTDSPGQLHLARTIRLLYRV